MDWKGLLGSIAPTFATALGGPVAGMAVKALSNTLLGHEDGTEADIGIAMANASPSDILKIKEADNAFKLEMQKNGIDLEKIAADDRASARDLQKQTRSKTVPILAGLTVAGFFGVVGWVLSGKVSLESTLLGFVLGQVSAKAEQVYNYYFGSSAGSKEKTDLLGKAK